MNKEINLVELEQKIKACYNDFIFTWVVTKNANTTAQEHKALVEKTANTIKAGEKVFDQVESAIKGIKGDDVLYIRQSIKAYRKAFEEFYKIYGREAEPNV